jgi:hypothetical protein
MNSHATTPYASTLTGPALHEFRGRGEVGTDDRGLIEEMRGPVGRRPVR